MNDVTKNEIFLGEFVSLYDSRQLIQLNYFENYFLTGIKKCRLCFYHVLPRQSMFLKLVETRRATLCYSFNVMFFSCWQLD